MRFMVSRIITSVSQLPTPGPPRRERVGKTRFCRVFIPSFELEACADTGGFFGVAGAGDDEDATGCWVAATRSARALAELLRAPTMVATVARGTQ